MKIIFDRKVYHYNAMTVVHVEGSSVERKLYHMLTQKLDIHNRLIDLYNSEINT